MAVPVPEIIYFLLSCILKLLSQHSFLKVRGALKTAVGSGRRSGKLCLKLTWDYCWAIVIIVLLKHAINS
jgi:hypothetical protein